MNPPSPTTLFTPRLFLRPPEEGDAAVIHALVSDWRVAEYALIPHPYPPDGAVNWIARSQLAWQEGSGAIFVVCLRDGGEIVGAISLSLPIDKPPNVGYWTGLASWGQGYASEALRRVIAYAFEDLALDRLHAYHVAHNPASGRVMQKAGLRFMEIVPGGFEHGGEIFDDVRYGIEAEEWRRAQEAAMA